MYVRYVIRRDYHDDDPSVQRQLRPRRFRVKPVHWRAWLVAGIVVGAVVAGTVTFLATGDDDQALGRVLLATIPGAVVGWLLIVVLAALGAFRTVDEL